MWTLLLNLNGQYGQARCRRAQPEPPCWLEAISNMITPLRRAVAPYRQDHLFRVKVQDGASGLLDYHLAGAHDEFPAVPSSSSFWQGAGQAAVPSTLALSVYRSEQALSMVLLRTLPSTMAPLIAVSSWPNRIKLTKCKVQSSAHRWSFE